MLMSHIEKKPKYEFLVDQRDGRRIVLLADRATIDAGGGTPLWYREAGNDESLQAILRWTGLRRARWTEWGELAERIGTQAFFAHMESLWEAEPLVRSLGTTITPAEDPEVLLLGEMIDGPCGIRFQLLYEHRFADAAARRKFLDWLHENVSLSGALLNFGYGSGTIELGGLLDDIAADQAARSAPRGRRRGRRIRMAA